MRRPILCVAAIAVSVVYCGLMSGSALSRDARVSAEGVSSLSYAPKPFYDDLSGMRVRFTTTGRARPGWQYVVSLIILGPDAQPENRCTSVLISSLPTDVIRPFHRVLGGTGKTNTVVFRADTFAPLSNYFCHGRATVRVYTAAIHKPKKGPSSSRAMRSLSFRILHAP
jgi:hypothetical protein